MLSKNIAVAVFKHFNNYKGSYRLYFKGLTNDVINQSEDRVELRIDGPYTRYFPGGVKYHDLEVNFLFTAHLSNSSLYKDREMVSQLKTGIFDNQGQRIHIPVYDGSTLIGCLKLRPIISGDREVREYYFGEIDVKTRLVQATLEAHYRLEET